ncbi:MAG: LamG domain-containing protein, partial [Planctomycetota bacterium]
MLTDGGDYWDAWPDISNRWTHVTLTHQGRTFKLYLDGQAIGEKDMGGANSVSGTLYLGGGPNHKEYVWNGQIDEVVLFNRPLSEEQIKLLYNTTDFKGREPVLTVTDGMIQDLSCHLRSDKPKFKADEIPTFKADVKDLLIDELSLAAVPSLGCQIEFDGTWYRWSGFEILTGYDQCGRIAKYGGFLRISLAEWL